MRNDRGLCALHDIFFFFFTHNVQHGASQGE